MSAPLRAFEVWYRDDPDLRAIIRATRMYSARIDFINTFKRAVPGLSFNLVRARHVSEAELAELGYSTATEPDT